MSRASDLREAIVTELKARIPGRVPTESFLVPDYNREELEKPRIGVRIGGREPEINLDGGPDRRIVSIEIGVIGMTPEARGVTTKQTYRQQQLKQADEYDALMESILALWTPWGPLSRCGLAEHRFVGISQPQAFDARQLYEKGVWVSMTKVDYFDTRDEPD